MTDIDNILQFDFEAFGHNVFVLLVGIIAIYKVGEEVVKIVRKIKHIPNPKNDEQDKAIAELKERADKYESDNQAFKDVIRLVLWDRLMHFGMNYIRLGHISYSDRDLWVRQWECYHFQFGGNGNLDDIKATIMALPLDETEPLLNRKSNDEH